MDDSSLPDDVRRFVLTSIPSVPFLEALLLMRADPARRWRKDALARRLYVRDRIAETLLLDLCTAGMAAPCDAPDSDAYCYRPDNEALRVQIDRLADLYATRLVEVTHLIHSSLDQ